MTRITNAYGANSPTLLEPEASDYVLLDAVERASRGGNPRVIRKAIWNCQDAGIPNGFIEDALTAGAKR